MTQEHYTHLCFSSFASVFCHPVGYQVLGGHRGKSVSRAAEDRERKYHSGPELPARVAEHVSVQSQNSKT